MKIMERASEQRNVVAACSNDLLKASLDPLKIDLDHCQKKLESYLEAKRKIFPRFYFVSNDVLLKILSKGNSEPHSVQEDFEKLFDAIQQVRFDEQDRRLITSVMQIKGDDIEEIQLTEGVQAQGMIE